MGSTVWPTQSVGLTDHPHILSESQWVSAQRRRKERSKTSGLYLDTFQITPELAHCLRAPPVCPGACPSSWERIWRGAPQAILGCFYGHVFPVDLQTCSSLSELLTTRELCFPGAANLKESGELTQVAREMERDSGTRAQNHDLRARGKGRNEIRIKTAYAFESHPCNPHMEKWAPRSKLNQNPLH